MALSHEEKKEKLRRKPLPSSVQEYMTTEPEPVKEEPVKSVKAKSSSIMDTLLRLPKWAYLAIAGGALIIILLAVVVPGLLSSQPMTPAQPEATAKIEAKVPSVTKEPEPVVTTAPLDPTAEDVVTVEVQGVVGDLPVIPGITVEQSQTIGNQEELDLSDTDLQVVIVPPEWAKNITDDEINATVSVGGFSDGQRLSDGSIRYIIGLKEYNAKRIELNTRLEDKIASYQMHSGETFVKQVKVANDKLGFSVYLTKVDDAKARSVAVDLLTVAKEYGLYATKGGVTPYVDIYDPDGNAIRSFRVNKDGEILTFEPNADGVMVAVQK